MSRFPFRIRKTLAKINRMPAMRPLVCVIDDDPEICDLLRISLETRNYGVLCARDGDEGLRLVLAEEPDLVLLDVKLPGINGYDLLQRIRQTPRLAHTLVVIMTSLTAGSPVSDQEWREKIGAADFVSKPFDPLDLVGRIDAILAKSHQEHETA